MKRPVPYALAALLSFLALSGGTARAYMSLSLGPNLDPTQIPVINNSVTCAHPNTAAQIKSAPDYDTPTISALQGVEGVSKVKVQLDANNTLQNDSLAQSSGNMLLDQAAMNESLKIRYASEVQNCQRVTGTYLLDVAFEDPSSNTQ